MQKRWVFLYTFQIKNEQFTVFSHPTYTLAQYPLNNNQIPYSLQAPKNSLKTLMLLILAWLDANHHARETDVKQCPSHERAKTLASRNSKSTADGRRTPICSLTHNGETFIGLWKGGSERPTLGVKFHVLIRRVLSPLWQRRAVWVGDDKKYVRIRGSHFLCWQGNIPVCEQSSVLNSGTPFLIESKWSVRKEPKKEEEVFLGLSTQGPFISSL